MLTSSFWEGGDTISDLNQKITYALNELKQISARGFSEETLAKYGPLILGENFNVIHCDNFLRQSLKTHFGIDISLEQLNEVLPSVCRFLSIACEPMKKVHDMDNSELAIYRVTF